MSQATQSSQDRRDELDVRLAVPSAQSARGMEIGMKILLINGSPKGDRSNTLKLSKAFLEGILEIHKDAEIRQLNLSGKKIAPCRGCFACWNKTPGKCVMTDDMQGGHRRRAVGGSHDLEFSTLLFQRSGAFEK